MDINLENKILNFNTEKRRQWAKERKPISAFIELTPKCNMNCVHCYLQDHHSLDEMSFEEIIEILDVLYDKGILFLTLSGGEIFSRKDFLDIYLYAKKRGFIVELFTNAFAITEEIIDVLKQYPPVLIDISLYGACEETYQKITGVRNSFQRVIDNCKKLKDADIRISLKSPIIKESYAEIDQMREVAKQLDVPFAVSYEIEVTIDNDDKTKAHQLSVEDMLKCEFDDYRTYGKKVSSTENDVDRVYQNDDNSLFICNVGQSSFIIDYKGNMCPCMKFRHRGVRLTRGNFDKIWKSFGEIQELKASKSYKCSSCKARYYCDACAAEREFMYGDLEAINEDVCRYANARYMYYIENKTEDEAIASLNRK